MSNISGHKVDLDEKRSVFVGRNVEPDGLTYIKMVNEEGHETRLKISQEAREALVALLSNDKVFAQDGGGSWVAVE